MGFFADWIWPIVVCILIPWIYGFFQKNEARTGLIAVLIPLKAQFEFLDDLQNKCKEENENILENPHALNLAKDIFQEKERLERFLISSEGNILRKHYFTSFLRSEDIISRFSTIQNLFSGANTAQFGPFGNLSLQLFMAMNLLNEKQMPILPQLYKLEEGIPKSFCLEKSFSIRRFLNALLRAENYDRFWERNESKGQF